MNKDLKKIADYYGCEAQRNQLVEEMAELTAAINRLHRAEKKQLISYDTPETEITELSMNQFAIRAGAYEDVVHEIADVEVCLKQVKYLMEIDKGKLKRTRDPQRRQPSPGRGAEPQASGRKKGRRGHIRAVCKAREIWIIHRNETPQRRTTEARTEGIYN